MSNSFRREVLQSFKSLHRARQKVFGGDAAALEKARIKINDEYRNKRSVVDQCAIYELISHAKAVENELRTTVVQAEEIQPGKYKLNITKETVKLDNMPYKG